MSADSQTSIEYGERVCTARSTRPEMMDENGRRYATRIDLPDRFLAQQIEVSPIFASDGHVACLRYQRYRGFCCQSAQRSYEGEKSQEVVGCILEFSGKVSGTHRVALALAFGVLDFELAFSFVDFVTLAFFGGG
jgi:hypothetical protein